jgi:hypothetical protein
MISAMRSLLLAGAVCAAWLPPVSSSAADAAAKKPVFLYSRYFNAEGETRYLPDGTFKDVLTRLGQQFEVWVSSEPLNERTLKDVAVVLIANPSDTAVGTNPPPHHVVAVDILELRRYLNNGGGLIVMGNQENHNLEVRYMNGLMGACGLQFTNSYTDVKQLVVPRSAPIIGGLRWAYYSGNLITLRTNSPAKPRAIVVNDLSKKPEKGTRDQAGILLAVSEPGKGRVVAVTDCGWITDDAFSGKGIGGVGIKEQDNWEIFLRLARWAAHVEK